MKLRGVTAAVIGALLAALFTPYSAQAAEPTVTVMSRKHLLGSRCRGCP